MPRIMLVGRRDNVLAEALWESLQEAGSSNHLTRSEPGSVANSDPTDPGIRMSTFLEPATATG